MRRIASDFVPSRNLQHGPRDSAPAWIATAAEGEWLTSTSLQPGWYRFRLHIRMLHDFAIRKRAILFADDKPLESFEWNREWNDTLYIRITQPAERIRLHVSCMQGAFQLPLLAIEPISQTRALLRALRLKWKLVSQYNCFWPVVARGGRLLARGQFGPFGQKVLKGIRDSRSMRLEVKRAEEVAASWWRRGAMSPETQAKWQADARAIPNPRPIAVVIPTDRPRADHARQSLLSVLRQVYPHWEAILSWHGGVVPRTLRDMTQWDTRIQLVEADHLRESLQKALLTTSCPRVLVLSPNFELAEQGLLRIAQVNRDDAVSLQQTESIDSATVCVVPVALAARVLQNLPGNATVEETIELLSQESSSEPVPTSEAIIRPFQGGRVQLRTAASSISRPLFFSSDLRGLSGWDHVAFEVIKGLHSLAVPTRRHPIARIESELLPPGALPESAPRRSSDPQLIIAPPFLCGRFAPDANTAIYTMWEVDRIGRAHVEVLNRARVVILPSEWGARCFRDSGVTVPLEVVPLGYDPLIYHPAPGTSAICTFGTAGALSQGGLRKNVRRVIELFLRAFPHENDVRLRVKITPNCPPLELPDDTRIEILRANLPASELAAWNRSLTAYVNASYAEGFGLHLLEAMACGRPLISTAYSGLTAFFNDSAGLVVPHRLVQTHNDVYQGRWADPDDDALVSAMRHLYHHREQAELLGEAAAAQARSFTWRDTGRKLLAVLHKHRLVGASK